VADLALKVAGGWWTRFAQIPFGLQLLNASYFEQYNIIRLLADAALKLLKWLLQCFLSVFVFSDMDIVMEYFEFAATEVASNKDEGSVLEAFRPAFDHILEQLSHASLSHSRLLVFADLIIFFTRNVHLAQVGLFTWLRWVCSPGSGGFVHLAQVGLFTWLS